MLIKFKNPGYSKDELEGLARKGVTYDKRTRKSLLLSTKTPRNADAASIIDFEDKINMRLPEQYKVFLLNFNGGVPSLQRFKICGMDASIIR